MIPWIRKTSTMNKDTAFNLLLQQEPANARITDTATYARHFKHPVPIIKEKMFSISRFTRLIFLSLAVACVFVLGYAFNQTFIKHDAGVKEYVAGTLFAALILLTLAMSLYAGLGKSKIIINTGSIDINGQEHPWSNILETYIVEQPGYKNRRYQLVLTLKSGAIVRHSLNIYNNIQASLAAHIEYFKQRRVQ